jgi:hypothetical protein
MSLLGGRLRGMTNATAIATALSMGIEVISSLNGCSSAYREKAESHTARIEEILRSERWSRVYNPEDVARDRERFYFHALMRQKYETASLRPWIPVPHDPAPPP